METPQTTPEVVSAPFTIPEGMTAADAKVRLEELKHDREWGQRYIKGGTDSREAREFDALTRHATGAEQPKAEKPPTEQERAVAGLEPPAKPEDYKLDKILRNPFNNDVAVEPDPETTEALTKTLLPAAHTYGLSQGDLELISYQVHRPIQDPDACEASLRNMFPGAKFDEAIDAFRKAVRPEDIALFEKYPETLGNNSQLIASIVRAYWRRNGVAK